MSQPCAKRRDWRIALGAVVAAAIGPMPASQAAAQSMQEPLAAAETDGAIAFDIPAQPLVEAIDAYSAISGVPVLYDSSIAVGLTSAPITGKWSPESALERLLSGTDLAASYTQSRAAIVTSPMQRALQVGAGAEAELEAVALQLDTLRVDGSSDMGAYEAYARLMFSDFRRALSADPNTRGRAYRLNAWVWVDPEGRIERVEVAQREGERRADGVVVQVLRNVMLSRAPPLHMPQPIRATILSQ